MDQIRYLDGRKINRFGCESDTQFHKVIAAENDAVPRGCPLPSVNAMQSYVDSITASRFWNARYGKRWWVRVKDGRGRVNAGARQIHLHQQRGGYLLMPRWSRCELVLLHEMTHLTMSKPHAWHGRLFAKTLLDLVRWRMGKETHNALRDAFRKHHVKWHPHRNKKCKGAKEHD